MHGGGGGGCKGEKGIFFTGMCNDVMSTIS